VDATAPRRVHRNGPTLSALYVAAGAPSPILSLLEQRWGFAPWVLTIAFAVYALGLLAALLVTGSLSDYVGRRPVMLGALALELVAMVMFAMAPNIGWVIAARILQGVATGAATSAFTAAVVEQAPRQHQRIGIVVGAVAPAGGLGLGALLAGLAIQTTSHANEIVFIALSVTMALGMVTTALSTDTVSTRPGAVASLRPRVAVPVRARREFAAAFPSLSPRGRSLVCSWVWRPASCAACSASTADWSVAQQHSSNPPPRPSPACGSASWHHGEPRSWEPRRSLPERR